MMMTTSNGSDYTSYNQILVRFHYQRMFFILFWMYLKIKIVLYTYVWNQVFNSLHSLLTFALRKSWLSDFVKHFQVFFVSF